MLHSGWEPEEPRVIDLSGRIAVVTGGSRGIGAATARLLARAGADVALHHRASPHEAEQVAAGIRAAGRRAWVLAADLADLDAVDRLARAVRVECGALDILVHNAGIWTPGRLESLPLDAWQLTMRVNLDAVFVLTRELLPLLRRSPAAAIVTVVSTAAQRGEAEHSHYAASKGALVSWTKSLAVELAPRIRVNAVAPGWVETGMVGPELDRPDRRREIEAAIPRGRVATPEDVAGPIVFLASDLAAHVTGEVLNVNGGAVLCG
jgi:3-oxoacyl-[acyl-carrier protein] reductase